MANPAEVLMQRLTVALPPIKIDGKVYFVADGSYSKISNESIVTENYTCDGGQARQAIHTGKARIKMTLVVPTSTDNLNTGNRPVPPNCTFGTLSDLLTTKVKSPPNDAVQIYDITSNWDYTTDPTHIGYITLGEEVPRNNDIGTWNVPCDIWARTYA